MTRLFLFFLVCMVTASGASPTDRTPTRAPRQSARAVIPFRAGERFRYDVSFGVLRVGHGSMHLAGLDTVRERSAWRATLTVTGSIPLFKLRDSTVSWFDTVTFSSLRFVQHLREGSYRADRDYQIYPERAAYSLSGRPEVPSVAEPLDQTSFLYFLRTIPLEVGERYEFFRYFQPEGNPVVISVLRRERVTVPAGTFNTVVVQPQIAAPGLFSKKERAEVWISDDSARMIVQIKSHVKFGALRLSLRSYDAGQLATGSGERAADKR